MYAKAHYDLIERLYSRKDIPNEEVKNILLQVDSGKYTEAGLGVTAHAINYVKDKIKDGSNILLVGMTMSPHNILAYSVMVGRTGTVTVIHEDQSTIDVAYSYQPGFNVDRIVHVLASDVNGYPVGQKYDFIDAYIDQSKVPVHMLARLKPKGVMLVRLYSDEYKVTRTCDTNGLSTEDGIHGAVTLMNGQRTCFQYSESLSNIKLYSGSTYYITRIKHPASYRLLELLRLSHERELEEDNRKRETRQTAARVLVKRAIPECPVCLDSMTPPTGICSNGHSVCSKCKTLLQTCPTCRSERINRPNITLDHVLNALNSEF